MINRCHAVPKSFLFVLGAGTLALLAGCQPANGTVAAQADRLCPSCRTHTRTMVITGQSFRVHSCPSCRRVSALDEATRAALERAFDAQAGPMVHRCNQCGTSSDCPLCRSTIERNYG